MIFYFSGTGNSYAAAKKIADRIEGEQLISLATFKNFELCQKEERIGIAFPCYMGVAPKVVLRFAEELFRRVDTSSIYIYVVVTYNHSDAATYLDFKEYVNAWFRVRMPQSDIYNSKPNTPETTAKILAAAKQKVEGFAEDILCKKPTIMYKRIPGMTALARFSSRTLMYKDMGSKLAADENCINCGQCVKFCPVENISFENSPIWGDRCESCFGCINRCPKNAIQLGKKTVGKARYINPDFENVYYG